MAQNISFKTIEPFLVRDERKASQTFSYAGLGLGILLLLAAIQMFINVNRLIREKNIRKDGFDFISVTKKITNENLAGDNRFTTADVNELRKQPFIDGAAPLNSNQFRSKASAGNIIPFSTDLFLESISNEFLDTLPKEFAWQPGQVDLPIIFSADYLEMYNVFAPAQDLPQISPATAGAVNITVECYGMDGVKHSYRGHIAAISDRINSILVPESFLTWANAEYGNSRNPPAARVFIKTKDANSPDLLNFLQDKQYQVNKDKTKFGRVKQVLQAVITGLGVFSVLVILLAMLLFSFYLQLMIAKSKDNLQLLMLQGYAPSWLSKTVSRKWIPVYAIIVLSALLVTQLGQYIFYKYALADNAALSPWLHWSTVLLALFMIVLCSLLNYRLVKNAVFRL